MKKQRKMKQQVIKIMNYEENIIQVNLQKNTIVICI